MVKMPMDRQTDRQINNPCVIAFINSFPFLSVHKIAYLKGHMTGSSNLMTLICLVALFNTFVTNVTQNPTQLTDIVVGRMFLLLLCILFNICIKKKSSPDVIY